MVEYVIGFCLYQYIVGSNYMSLVAMPVGLLRGLRTAVSLLLASTLFLDAAANDILIRLVPTSQ